MVVSQRTANAFGYISLVVLLLLLILVLLGILPDPLRLPLFFLALALFMVRITLRLLIERQKRAAGKNEAESPD